MASAFIASAVNLNSNLQEHLTCVIHRGLLNRPMLFPCSGKHRLCHECLEGLVGSQHNISCPECREWHDVPSDWATVWFDRVLSTVTTMLARSEADINQKVTKFVQESYNRYGTSEQRLHIKSVQLVSNPRLKENFEHYKRLLNCNDVRTLLHGTTRKAALLISGQGFHIPESFQRGLDGDQEGELKFGKAVYFAETKKASEYGNNTLVLTDCILGRVKKTDISELKLHPDTAEEHGFDTIHYENEREGSANQEWAIFKSGQCYPLCIIDYEFLDAKGQPEQNLVDKIRKMKNLWPDYNLLQQALTGTDNQRKAVLQLIGDAGSQGLPQASIMMHFLLQNPSKELITQLLTRSNETVRILFLRALWQTGQHDRKLQPLIYMSINWSLLTESLHSSYADVSWRVCGVLTNLVAVMTSVSKMLLSPGVLNQLMAILKRAVQFEDKICILTVLNLLANIAATEYAAIKQNTHILNYVNETLLDHDDSDIQEGGNRLFCNIIGKGTFSYDWLLGGYKDKVMAPSIE